MPIFCTFFVELNLLQVRQVFDHFSYRIRHWSVNSLKDFLSFLLDHVSIYHFSFYHQNVHILLPPLPPARRSLMQKGCWLASLLQNLITSILCLAASLMIIYCILRCL